MTTITIPIDPLPTPRPRVARFGGVYYPKRYQDYKDALETFIDGLCLTPANDEFAVSIDIHVKQPKKTKKVRPSGDLDNYAKGVLDALTTRLWIDDDQVTSLTVTKSWGVGSIIVKATNKGSQ